MFLGIVIFGAKFSDLGDPDLGWAFGMAIIGMFFTIAASVTAGIQMYKSMHQ